METLAFNFANGTFAYKRLAQGFSRSVDVCLLLRASFASSPTQLSRLNNVLKTWMILAMQPTMQRILPGAIGRSFSTIQDWIWQIKSAIFESGKLSSWTEPFQSRRYHHKHRVQKISGKLRFPKSEKVLQRYLVFVNYYISFITSFGEKLRPLNKLLKAEVPISITSELKTSFDSVNKALSDACELALNQPIPGKHLVLLTDASFKSAGYALMIEINPNQNIQTIRKT